MDPREDTELKALLATQADRHAAPSELRARIVDAICESDAASPHPTARQGWRSWWNMGAAFAMGILVSVGATGFLAASNAREARSHEVVASHVRSLMAAHLTDIASADRHAVKPWFTGKLDFSPPVRDLAAAGFPLVGGRLDYIGSRPAAALIYRHRQHIINVFVWPRDERSPAPPAAFLAQGFNVTGWQDDSMQFWLVSDLNASELAQFAQLLRKAGS